MDEGGDGSDGIVTVDFLMDVRDGSKIFGLNLGGGSL